MRPDGVTDALDKAAACAHAFLAHESAISDELDR